MEKIIEVHGLKKSYGNIQAVKGIDFYVERGKFFAFLGPNGAGKSTTIDIICTFLKPDEGTVTINGYTLGQNNSEIRNIIGAVFQDGLLDGLLTVEENLKARGGLYGLKGKALAEAVERTAELTGVSELLKRPYGTLSGGQRRRCDIARALINTPKILFLDEPTTGLDPQTRKAVWGTLAKVKEQSGMTVFLTTHYMEEAAFADYVIVIDDGKITAKGTPNELKGKYSKDKFIFSTNEPESVKQILCGMKIDFVKTSDTFQIELENTLSAIQLIKALEHYITDFEVIRGTMDDAFIAITGKDLRE